MFERGTLLDCGACAPPGLRWQGIDRVIGEMPQRYPHDPVNPQDLITLAYRLGLVLGPLLMAGVPVELVMPRDWKGTIDKVRHHPRIVGKLRPAEREVYERARKPLGEKARGDMTDAVGLGQWVLAARVSWRG